MCAISISDDAPYNNRTMAIRSPRVIRQPEPTHAATAHAMHIYAYIQRMGRNNTLVQVCSIGAHASPSRAPVRRVSEGRSGLANVVRLTISEAQHPCSCRFVEASNLVLMNRISRKRRSRVKERICHGICTVLARDEGLTVNDYGTLYTLLISAVAVTT